MIRVAILANRLARMEALAEMLEEDDRLEVIASGDLSARTADVVLAVEMATAQIPDEGPPVVLLGAEADPLSLADNLHAALPRNASDAQIIAALVAAANDFTVLTPAQAKRLLRHSVFDEDQAPLVEHLTRRETEVLQMLAGGLGNKEIAASLGISPNTAKFHVAQIIAKLHAASRTEAVSLGIRRGLIPI